jgi:hypothetical protein
MENQTNSSATIQEKGRGTIILVFGILSIILLGPILGIPAWIMGNKDLKKIKNGIISITEKTNTKVGMVLGIIGTFFSIFSIIIVGIAIVVGVNLFNAQAGESAKDAMVAESTNIAALAQQYYRKPVSMGGGGLTFEGFVIPVNISSTYNGTYEISNISANEISITGTPLSDAGYTFTVNTTVTPESISSIINGE